MMRVLACVACFFLAGIAELLSDKNLSEWQMFKKKYNKTYGSNAEEENRFKVYMEKKKMVEEHNARYEKGEFTYKMNLNKFSDMPLEELAEKFKGYNKPERSHSEHELEENSIKETLYVPPEDVVVPTEMNWVDKGAVTPIKDQGSCWSSWAFSATGSLEGQHFLKTGKLVSLSEQNLIDCSWNEGNGGCHWGFTNFAFQYIIKNKGIDTEASYPYEAINDICRFKQNNTGATVSSIVNIPPGDEDALKSTVATIGPISVSIFTQLNSFIHYSGGIYQDLQCKKSKPELNNAALVVGYGTDNKTNLDYWIIKNSWGKSWGEKGYMRIVRGHNECGVATEPFYPKL